MRITNHITFKDYAGILGRDAGVLSTKEVGALLCA